MTIDERSKKEIKKKMQYGFNREAINISALA